MNTVLAAIFILLILSLLEEGVAAGYSSQVPFWSRGQLSGLWRLTSTKSFLPKQVVLPEKSAAREEEKTKKEEVLLMLHEDGSFTPYPLYHAETPDPPSLDESTNSSDEDDDDNSNKNDQEPVLESVVESIMGIGRLQGKWQYTGSTLVLASDRPPNSNGRKVHDTILVGKVSSETRKCLTDNPILSKNETTTFSVTNNHNTSTITTTSSTSSSTSGQEAAPEYDNDNVNDVYLSIPEGDVCMGKFMYPSKHPSFFDQPMLFQPTILGSFHLQQVLGMLNTNLGRNSKDPNAKPKITPKYHKKNFYGRKFLVTAIPVPTLVQEDYPTFDIRVLSIEFLSNNTFAVVGADKILRGRFGLAGEHRDRLWFQVSMFGAGRSMPGSVYSEGKGLTDEDRRGYAGAIEEVEGNDNSSSTIEEDSTKTFLNIQGNIWHGSDFAKDSKPSPEGTFTMKEVLQFEDYEDEDEDEDEIEVDFSESGFQ